MKFRNANKYFFVIFSIFYLGLSSCDSEVNNKVTTNISPKLIFGDITPYQTIDEAISDINNIDWNNEIRKANAITVAYAVKEIQAHFSLIGLNTTFSNLEAPCGQASYIHLKIDVNAQIANNIDDVDIKQQSYSVTKEGDEIRILANHRIGLLYGSYRFLEFEGFKWHDQNETLLPANSFESGSYQVTESPKTKYRGFWLYNETPLADSYLIWMAKNRLNLVGSASPKLKNLLGFKTWGGGHKLIQEVFSEPGLFELHEDWFGYKNGIYHEIKATGTYFNPSFVNPAIAEYFSDKIITRLQSGDLKNVDILNVWPTDRTGGVFDRSPTALEFGNDTDNLLVFYKNVARNFRLAYQNGRLNRIVKLAGISYFNTWQPPTRTDVTSELGDESYIHIFYFNERTWSSPLLDQSSPHDSNQKIINNLTKWKENSKLNFGTVDYYNYSTYAGIALTNHLNFEEDYNSLKDVNKDIVAYMHPLLLNPGPRRLTNQLIAKLTWNTTDVGAISHGGSVFEDYFRVRFGVYANDIKTLYQQYASAIDNTKEIYGDFSLKYNLFKSVFWGTPFEDKDIDIFNRFLEGGTRQLPIIFQDSTYVETFRGLDESIIQLDDLLTRWEDLQVNIQDSKISNRVLDDILWVESTLLRYRLTKLSVQYAVASIKDIERSEYRESIQNIIDQMQDLPVLHDTISPVNQTQFLGWSQSLINSF